MRFDSRCLCRVIRLSDILVIVLFVCGYWAGISDYDTVLVLGLYVHAIVVNINVRMVGGP